MYCSKCGNQISENDRFCPHCGAPVTQNAESETYDFTRGAPAYSPENTQKFKAVHTEVANDSKSITAFVFSIISIVASSFFGFIFGIVAVVLSRDSKDYNKLAKAAYVIGVVGIVLGILSTILSITLIVINASAYKDMYMYLSSLH